MQTQRSFVWLLERLNISSWPSSELSLLHSRASTSCFSPLQHRSFTAQKPTLQQGKQQYQPRSSQVSNKDCCCAGLQTCPQSSKYCCLGEKWILTVLFVPPLASQSTGLWKCITQCWEAKISRALVSAMLLFPLKILPASDHCFQKKKNKNVAKRSTARNPSWFWLSTCNCRNIYIPHLLIW